ncbi:MAG: squalene/phytoene synthase family protein [Chthoniobacterales bacterium]
MSVLSDWDLIASVSRSFYFSLRLLPGPVRSPVALAYLLARLSDTIADESKWPEDVRLQILKNLPACWQSPEDFADPPPFENSRDALLVSRAGELLEVVKKHADRDLIENVWRTILHGQIFDIEHFSGASDEGKTLSNEKLEKYIYEVAGCVGSFWTRISERHLPGWRQMDFHKMESLGVAYGKGLQLVNILRDASADREQGRFYFREKNYDELFQRCQNYLTEGSQYVRNIRFRRLKVASSLPLDLAFPTLRLIEKPEIKRKKISRRDALFRVGWRILRG